MTWRGIDDRKGQVCRLSNVPRGHLRGIQITYHGGPRCSRIGLPRSASVPRSTVTANPCSITGAFDCQLRHRSRPVVRHRHKGRVVAPHASTTAQHGTRVDAREESARAVAGEQRRGVDRKHARRCGIRLGAAACPQPCAGTDETVAPPRFRPEEHMSIDMPPPGIGPAGEAASQGGGERPIRHQLRAQNGDPARGPDRPAEMRRDWPRRPQAPQADTGLPPAAAPSPSTTPRRRPPR